MSMSIDSNLTPLTPEPHPHPPRPHPPGPGPAPHPAGPTPPPNGEVDLVAASVQKNQVDPAVVAGAVPSAFELGNLEASKELMPPVEAANVTYDEFLTVSAANQEWASKDSTQVNLASLSMSDPQRWPNIKPQYLANSNGVSMMSHAMGINSRNVQDQNHFEFHYAKAVVGPTGGAAVAAGASATAAAAPKPPSPYVSYDTSDDSSSSSSSSEDDSDDNGIVSIWHDNTAMFATTGGPRVGGTSITVASIDIEGGAQAGPPTPPPPGPHPEPGPHPNPGPSPIPPSPGPHAGSGHAGAATATYSAPNPAAAAHTASDGASMASKADAAAGAGTKSRIISSTGPEDFLDQANAMFDPDRTANRLTDFAVSLYPLSQGYKQQGDTPDARQAHATRMSAAVDQAYAVTDQTAGDDLTDAQIAGLAQSQQGVKAGLATFVSQGPDPDKAAEGGLYDRLRTYAVSGRSSYANPALVNPANGVVNQHPAMSSMAGMLDLEV